MISSQLGSPKYSSAVALLLATQRARSARQVVQRSGDHQIRGMKNVELTDPEAEPLVRLLRNTIADDRYPLSPRVILLKEILGKLKPEPARPAAALPEPRVYEPPSKGRYRRRGG